MYNNFINQSPLSKTLRNALIPTESTKKHIAENGIITADEIRNNKRQELMEIMDDYYRAYIHKHLSNTDDIDWYILFKTIEECRKDSSNVNKKNLEAVQADIRKQLAKKLSADDDYNKLFCAKIITKILPDFIEENSLYSEEDKQEKKDVVSLFSNFGTYFKEFFSNRKNVFSSEAIATSICYRIVNENADIFWTNILTYKRIIERCPDEKSGIEDEITKTLEKNIYVNTFNNLENIYCVEFYPHLVEQSYIDYYNEVCGVINRHMNLYCQRNKDNRNLYSMRKLYKQILSVSSSSFDVAHMFQNDDGVYQNINSFIGRMRDIDIVKRLRSLGDLTKPYDLSKIYISSGYYDRISKYMSGSWSDLNICLRRYYEEILAGKPGDKAERIDKEIRQDKYKSLEDLDTLFDKYLVSEGNNTDYKTAESYIAEIQTIASQCTYEPMQPGHNMKLIEDYDKISEIKERLDTYMNMLHWCKAFVIDIAVDKDLIFYSELETIYDELKEIVPVYNRVRNYVTQKPYSTEKIKLNFDCPTLADGWSESKEYSNNAIILCRDNKYYLAIFNAADKPDKNVICGKAKMMSKLDYKKMVYNLLPGPNKMLPKVMLVSEKAKKTYFPSKELLDAYNAGKHKKSSKNFDISFCRELIDYYKKCIELSDWKKFNFKFSDTDSYNDISEFFNEVESQGYMIDWTYISEEDINRLDEEGKLYLFQIYNKDFSEKSTGTKNLHTMYFENLFSEENLKDTVLKLNGEAELFYRKASIKNPVIHRKGDILVNKCIVTEVNGKQIKESIPDNIYMELCRYYAERIAFEEMSDDAKKYVDKVEYRIADKDIVKDRRYTEDKFFIHIPMTINFKAKKCSNINDRTVEYIANQENMHIIGIDRGERNLIYVSVIDCHGHIVEQKSFNAVNRYDYKSKLKEKERSRADARKNWQEIGKIKELKEGYLSLVIHEITEMMLKYNAVIVMEDLNYGFKRGRFKVERQVYQKFENMLIDKLNYLVSKSRCVDEDGGLLRGYQLTEEVAGVKETRRQNGFIFYVPAAYTSKIDPTTGFVNVFRFNDLKTNSSRKEFLMKFDEISYDKNRNMYKFTFDYNNFITHNTTLAKTRWEVYTNGDRIKREYSGGGSRYASKKVDITKELNIGFAEEGINYEEGHNLVEDIEQMDERKDSSLITKIVDIFKLTVQLRDSMSEAEDENYDRLISPVINEEGEFYDSNNYTAGKTDISAAMPKDADANGAYCIALKGLFEVMQIKSHWTPDGFDRALLRIDNAKWFDFIQNKRYR